jgi:hypothetical protein
MVLEAVIAATPTWYSIAYLIFYGLDIVGAFGVGLLAWTAVLLGLI